MVTLCLRNGSEKGTRSFLGTQRGVTASVLESLSNRVFFLELPGTGSSRYFSAGQKEDVVAEC